MSAAGRDLLDLFKDVSFTFIAPAKIDGVVEDRCRNLVDQRIDVPHADARCLLAEIYRLRHDLSEATRAPGRPARRAQGILAGPEPRTLARASDPSTSREAADAVVADGTVSRQHLAVFEALKRSGPSTAHELAGDWSGLTRDITTRRLPELERLGRVRRLGSRKCARTGRTATVWEVC